MNNSKVIVVGVALAFIVAIFSNHAILTAFSADEAIEEMYVPVSNSILWERDIVNWEDKHTTTVDVETIVQIEESKVIKTNAVAPTQTYTDDDLYCLAVAIYYEAGADAVCDECRRMVADVILNRVNDSRFPNTIREVLEEPGQYGTLAKTGVVFPERSKMPQEAHAVERAYRIAKEALEGTHTWLYGAGVVFQSEYKHLGTGIAHYHDGFYYNYG